MYWQEEKKDSSEFVVPDDIVDICFAISCKMLPLDHAYALSSAVISVLPWLKDEQNTAIHQIHVAESGNGWMRPQDPENEVLHLSRRTKLTIRIPKERKSDAENLTGNKLQIGTFSMEIGKASTKLLAKTTTVFSRYVTGEPEQNEQNFLEQQYKRLMALGVKPRKMLCGKQTVIQHPDNPVYTRSLMLADLEVEEAITLQQQGIGDGQLLGCGIFLPHKSVQPVKDISEQTSK